MSSWCADPFTTVGRPVVARFLRDLRFHRLTITERGSEPLEFGKGVADHLGEAIEAAFTIKDARSFYRKVRCLWFSSGLAWFLARLLAPC
jgi:hypothetical protein